MRLNRKLAELEKKLYGQLEATEADLAEWESSPYEMDSQTVAKFWSLVESAPAVGVVGDYDCDGICGSYIMARAIRAVCPGKRVKVRVPRRFSEGYGFNSAIAEEMADSLPEGSVVVTVDNGISAAEALEALESKGIKVVVTDHHELGNARVPKTTMVLNPKVEGCCESFDGDYWCGAAVAYKLAEQVVPSEVAEHLSVFAGLATVADCMELRKGNWGLVRSTVDKIRSGHAPASILALLDGMGQDPKFASEETLGYYLGPAFNAPGRLDDRGAQIVLRYLLSPSQAGADEIIAMNNERKRVRDEEYELVKAAAVEQGQVGADPMWVYVPGLHEGIVGILAGKAAEDYGASAVVLTDSSEPGVLKGSARAFGDTNILEDLLNCGDIFEKVGGHERAAGLSIKEEALGVAISHQGQRAQREVHASDATSIEAAEIPAVSEVVCKFKPFGEGNPAPKFAVDVDMSEDGARMVGKNGEHLVIQNKAAGYKITHFNHEPNSLSNKSRFELIGEVKKTGFANKETPTLDAREAVDIYDDREQDLSDI